MLFVQDNIAFISNKKILKTERIGQVEKQILVGNEWMFRCPPVVQIRWNKILLSNQGPSKGQSYYSDLYYKEKHSDINLE